MDTTRIEKRIGVRAPSDRIWEILSDLENWHRWNPYETGVTGALAFGGGINLTEALPGMVERQVQARIGDWQPYSQLVWAEKRGWLFNAIRYYEIEELDRGSCIVSNGVIFTGLRGELFHDKHRPTIRAAYEEIGEALRRAAEG
ncbi:MULTISPECIES: SRPBCC family protein [unclassified Brevundimonas]|uniref:SRPBCC family protein n=1 Tax=unclassified Brevundimonas TaxID=2622653 RepID=UPI003F90897C